MILVHSGYGRTIQDERRTMDDIDNIAEPVLPGPTPYSLTYPMARIATDVFLQIVLVIVLG